MLKFEMPRENSAIIKVIGVGGGGSNAVNYMYRQQIKGVDFIVCNTDSQSLDLSPVPNKIQLGKSLTSGLGAGAIPEVGRNAAIENIEEIKSMLQNTRMVFITAGMGGGTGTGAAPVIAKAAKEMGILTVGIVTIPFSFEGKKRKQQAEEGLENMRQAVDTLLVINNDKLREMYGNLTLANAFGQADEVLNTAARGIAEMISVTGLINVDFNDVNTVMRDSGVAIMGSALASGESRARVAVEKALSSPLLNDNHILGAKYVLLNISYGLQEVTMDEIAEITDYIQEEAGSTADVIWGHGYDESLGDSVLVTVIATGFNRTPDTGIPMKAPEKKVVTLTEDFPVVNNAPLTSPISSPTQMSAPVNFDATVEPYLKNAGPEIVSEKPAVQEIPTDEPVLKIVESPVVNTIETPVVNTIETTVVNEVESPVVHQLEEESIIEKTIAPIAETPSVNEYKEVIAEDEDDFQFEVKTVEAEKPSVQEIRVEVKPIEETPKTQEVEEKKIVHWLTEDNEIKNEVKNEVHTPVEEKKNEVRAEVNTTPQAQPMLFPEDSVSEKGLSAEEQQRRANERLARIKELSAKLKTPSGLNDLESTPAYLRRNVSLNETKHSSESSISKYTISEETDENGKKNGGLRSNNSFLHDNVD